jgi:hypothetical protein
MSIPWWTELINDKSIPYGVHIIGKPGNDEIVMMAWKIIEGL